MESTLGTLATNTIMRIRARFMLVLNYFSHREIPLHSSLPPMEQVLEVQTGVTEGYLVKTEFFYKTYCTGWRYWNTGSKLMMILMRQVD